MMIADLEDLMFVSRLYPAMTWSSSAVRLVVIARDGNILRLYWVPVLLWLDKDRADLFIEQLNIQ